jgi:hypothetical protein
MNDFEGKFYCFSRVPYAAFRASIIFIMDTLPPIRHVTATSAVKLLRNAVVTSWAHASIILFAFEFRVRHWGHIVRGGILNVSVGSTN